MEEGEEEEEEEEEENLLEQVDELLHLLPEGPDADAGRLLGGPGGRLHRPPPPQALQITCWTYWPCKSHTFFPFFLSFFLQMKKASSFMQFVLKC